MVDEIEPELIPETFDYAPFILDMNLPDELLAKTESNVHAKFVSNEWTSVKNQVMTLNEMIARILYEIDISSVLDSSKNWLPMNAESKDSGGFQWKTEEYMAKFYHGEAWVTEVGVDETNRYVNWYYGDSDWEGSMLGIQQSLDRKSGFMFVDGWGSDRGGIIHNYQKTSWELQHDKLIYTIIWSREYRGIEEFNIIWNGELSANGSGILTNNESCPDTYFWDAEGNGVYESRDVVGTQGDCLIEIVEW